jgi:hypothetical protein
MCLRFYVGCLAPHYKDTYGVWTNLAEDVTEALA